jgi:hypothetical protein
MHLPPLRSARFCLLLAGAAALAGCSDSGGYPSLAPRAVEQPVSGDDAPAAPTLPVDAALDAEVATLAAQAAKGQADFDRVANESCAAIARGASAQEGSEPWIAAQQALSALEAARAPVLASAAALDRLVIERGTAGGNAVDLTGLAEAQAQVSAIDTAEQARLAELSAGRCTR